MQGHIRSRLDTAVDLALLSLTVYVSTFLHSRTFGLYEDDWWRVGQMTFTPRRELLGILGDFWAFRVGQGRPLHDTLILVLSFLGWRLGELQAIYLIGCAILTINVILLYFLLRRITQSALAGLGGALLFCLYPADTTRPFLTHALGVQPSITFLLLACLLYVSGRRVLSYVVSALCLLSYETVFPLFLAIPLARAAWDRTLLKALLKHGVIVAAILLADGLLRGAAGDKRLSSTSLATAVVALRAMSIGPAVSLSRFLLAPLDLISEAGSRISWEMLVAGIGACGIFTSALWRYLGRPEREAISVHSRSRWPKIAAAGFVMTVLSYALALTTDPTAVSGRDTRVHAPAAVGLALAGAALTSALEQHRGRLSRRRAATLAMAAVFASWLCVSLHVQADYTRSWALQRQFWTSFVALNPDLTEGNVYLVDPQPDTASILAFGWSMAIVPENIWYFPVNWKNPPRAFLFKDEWRGRYCSGREPLFQASEWIPKDLPSVVAGYSGMPMKVTTIGTEGGTLCLKTSLCPCDGCKSENAPRPAETSQLHWRKKPLYHFLIQ